MLRLAVFLLAATVLVSGSVLRPIQPRKPVGECPAHQGSTPVYLADSDDCTKFYECDAAGNACPKECPPGTEFNPTLKVCDRPETANCKAGGSKHVLPIKPKSIHPFSPVGDCPVPQGEHPKYLADSKDCSIFYECDQNGNPVPKECQLGLEFNPDLQVCDWPSSSGCKASSRRTFKMMHQSRKAQEQKRLLDMAKLRPKPLPLKLH